MKILTSAKLLIITFITNLFTFTLLLPGLDEITDVSNLTNLSPRYSIDEVLSPIGLTQSILCGRLAPGKSSVP